MMILKCVCVISLSLNIPINKKVWRKIRFTLLHTMRFLLIRKPNYFDRDRIYGGVGYFFNDSLKIEVGVMSQILTDGQ